MAGVKKFKAHTQTRLWSFERRDWAWQQLCHKLRTWELNVSLTTIVPLIGDLRAGCELDNNCATNCGWPAWPSSSRRPTGCIYYCVLGFIYYLLLACDNCDSGWGARGKLEISLSRLLLKRDYLLLKTHCLPQICVWSPRQAVVMQSKIKLANKLKYLFYNIQRITIKHSKWWLFNLMLYATYVTSSGKDKCN